MQFDGAICSNSNHHDSMKIDGHVKGDDNNDDRICHGNNAHRQRDKCVKTNTSKSIDDMICRVYADMVTQV